MSLDAVFREAALRGERVCVADLLRLHGPSSLPGLLVALSVLSMIPVAGVGTALSLPLFAIALRWPRTRGAARSRDVPLPARVLETPLSSSWSRRILRVFAAIYAAAQSSMHRRCVSLRHPRKSALWRAWIAAMGILILLPLPLGNLLPGLSLVLLGLGWTFKDGVALILSLVVGLAALAYLAVSLHVLAAMYQAMLAWW